MSAPDSCCLSGWVGCWGARWGGAGGCPGWCRAGSRSGWWGSGSCWRSWWCEPELKQRNIFNIQHLNKNSTFETLVFNHMAEYCPPIGLFQSAVQWEHSILSLCQRCRLSNVVFIQMLDCYCGASDVWLWQIVTILNWSGRDNLASCSLSYYSVGNSPEFIQLTKLETCQMSK